MLVDKMYLEILRRKCAIPINQADAGSEFEVFYDDAFMSYLLEDASIRHNQKPFRNNLSDLPSVYLLARIEVFTILAGAFAKNYNIGSKDGKLEKSQPFEHYHKLIKEMRITYATIGASSSVRPTTVLLSNTTRNLYKNYLNAPDPVVDIKLVDNTEQEVQFNIVPMSSVALTSIDIYLGEEPVYDLVEYNNINPTSTKVETVPYTTNTYRVTKTETSKYLGVVAKNKYGRQYILEYNIEIPLTPPQEEEVTP